MKPRLLFVGRGPYRLPLDPGLARRFAALGAVLEYRQLAAAARASEGSEPRFSLVRPFPIRRLDGLVWHVLLPFRIARELRSLDPDIVLVHGAQETTLALVGRALARSRAAVVLDVHGDWRAPTRLYGSPARRLLDPLSGSLVRAALRRADAVRTVSAYTSGLVRAEGVEPAAEFPAYMDLEPFTARPIVPMPTMPRALFVGVLERNKAVDVLEEAWRVVARQVPDAVLQVVGQGTLAPRVSLLADERPAGIQWTPVLTAMEVSDALDASTVLVLPSRTEGLGRVLVEAACRGRAVVASRVGGIPDVVADGETGILVPPGDAQALADALVRVLTDRAFAERLGSEARARVEPWLVTPEEYARRVRDLVDKVVARE
jgi:glycosyltransferase involved in cell wall biosynthesis